MFEQWLSLVDEPIHQACGSFPVQAQQRGTQVCVCSQQLAQSASPHQQQGGRCPSPRFIRSRQSGQQWDVAKPLTRLQQVDDRFAPRMWADRQFDRARGHADPTIGHRSLRRYGVMSRYVPDRTMLEESSLQLQGKRPEPVVRSERFYFGSIQADACLIGERRVDGVVQRVISASQHREFGLALCQEGTDGLLRRRFGQHSRETHAAIFTVLASVRSCKLTEGDV